LRHKSCHECGSSVPFSAESCPNCGAFTGKVWLAIIAEQGEQKQEKTEDLWSLTGEYLDLGRRYRLIASDHTALCHLAQSPLSPKLFQGQVLDCQPLQKSVLGILLEQQTGLWEEREGTSENAPDKEASLWQRIGIPELARPYLTLKDCFPIVPTVHDAWLEEKKEVILLCDRSEWQLLSDWWRDEQVSVEEIIAQFKEISNLWERLAQASCNQSLLVEGNLRVSQERTLGLEQLYQNPPNTQLTLPDLAKHWQQMLQSSKVETIEPLSQLLEQLIDGAIDSAGELQGKLEELAQKQQVVTNRQRQPMKPSAQKFSASEPITERLILAPDEDENTLDSGSMKSIGQVTQGEDLSTAVLPMQLLNLVDAGSTDRGRQRHHNEDYFGMRSQIRKQQSSRSKKYHSRGLYLVCDGMGGHAAGEVASAMAVETLQKYFLTHWQDELPDRETIKKGVLLANQTIFNINQKNARSGNGRMGTTLVMALVQDTKVAIAHVGDSRIYRITRKGGLEQLTVDHEVGQRAIQDGIAPEIAYARPDAYQLTQALGPHASKFIQPDIQFLDLQEDTLLLLCSDGLSDNRLIETHWQTHLTPLISSSSNLEKGIRKLIDFANQHNGHDNITAILVRMKVRPYLGHGNW
jgi:protein phosphatase